MRSRHLLTCAALAIAVTGPACTGSSQPTVTQAPSTVTEPEPAHGDDVFLDLRTGTATPIPERIQRRGEAAGYRASQDGRRLAFERLVGAFRQIFVARIDGRAVHQVTHGHEDATDPSWSPDGGRLVYERRNRIFIVHLASRRVHQLTPLPGELELASFTADGRRVLFTRVTRQRMSLWWAPAGGGPSRLVIQGAAYGAISPDGGTIAFHRVGRAVEPGMIWPFQRAIMLANADGLAARRITPGQGSMMAPIDWSYVRPLWSPDGTRIVHADGAPVLESRMQVIEARSGRQRGVVGAEAVSWLDDRTLILDRDPV